ncbi:MAG: dockerin type I domain-containing protein [Pirellulaceae bacterium]
MTLAFGLHLVASTTLSDPEVDRAIDLLHGLRISEVMYHPQDSESLEFIEVTNVLDRAINVRGVRLGGGVDATLGDALLSPGERAVVVADAAAFRTAYGESVRILAEYDGQLRNSSERIQLQLPAPYDAMILDFEYDDAWYISTDGQGASLELRSTNVPVEAWRTADAWQASVRDGGTPGSPPITLDGDVNQDSKLDIIDVNLLCLHIRTNQQVPTSDVNGDGQVNDVDLSDLIGSVFQTSVGDVNLDGKFDSADLVLIFQAGEYQDSRTGNSVWSTGDWNCDGEFDSSDLVVAFQTGRYQA